MTRLAPRLSSSKREVMVVTAVLALVTCLALVSPSRASASPFDGISNIEYLSTNADNVCTYGYNQNNKYTVRCLSIYYGSFYLDTDYWWKGQVQIIWSWADHYLNTSTCTMRPNSGSYSYCYQYQNS